MKMKKILIIDYGMGNLFSVKSAFNYIGAEVEISQEVSDILNHEYIVLPGVGSFFRAMKKIRKRGIDEAINNAIKENNSKILGICLGMQLLGKNSTEDGLSDGLNLVDNEVKIIEASRVKVPHIGFDKVCFPKGWNLFKNINNDSAFYFVHSYKMLNQVDLPNVAICNYGGEFVAAFQSGNIYGTQFHPEKSQSNGLQLIANFIS